jgi:hypothetical protein
MDATRASIQVRNGWRPHGRRLGQPAAPSKDARNFVQTMGSTSPNKIGIVVRRPLSFPHGYADFQKVFQRGLDAIGKACYTSRLS